MVAMVWGTNYSAKILIAEAWGTNNSTKIVIPIAWATNYSTKGALEQMTRTKDLKDKRGEGVGPSTSKHNPKVLKFLPKTIKHLLVLICFCSLNVLRFQTRKKAP